MKQNKNRTLQLDRKSSKYNMVTPVATGIAVISGLVAVGSALTDKGTRALFTKHAQRGLDILQNVAASLQEEPEKYKAIAHEITSKKKARKLKKEPS